MILPSRLAFVVEADDDDDGSLLPHVVESVEEENRPAEELLPPGAACLCARRRMSQCRTEVGSPGPGEYWLLMLPSLAELSPLSSSSELLREALVRTSTPGVVCSSLDGKEVPMAPSEASLVRTS